MDFDSNKPIYLQIAEFFYENILKGRWKGNERIPSIREIAMMVEVNPNTAIRAFNHLQDEGVIYNKRGIGYYVSSDGYERVLAIKQKEFLEANIPEIFRMMDMLGIPFDEIEQAYTNYIKIMGHEKK
jgi:DNA-binding transcriptional regulator YhcF (GntR family)